MNPTAQPPTRLELAFHGHFPRTLRDTRLAHRFDLRDMASQVGVAPKTYDDWECGKNLPDTNYLTIICRVLGVSADYLLGQA